MRNRIFKFLTGQIEENITNSFYDVTLQVSEPVSDYSWSRFKLAVGRGVKRGLDIAFALVFIFISLPMLLFIAAAIKLTSKGPVFFTQERVGINGQKFKIYKFRTMRPENSQEEHHEYIQNLLKEDYEVDNDKVLQSYFEFIDNRTTPVGKFLRATSLDELPQLFNILGGKMSLVGPRPHPTYEVDEYKSWYKRRLSVKPGLTGWSKLNLRLTPKNYEESILYDLWYVDNWSVLLDIQIILMTVPFVLSMKDAH